MTETEIRFALTPPLAVSLRKHYLDTQATSTEQNETVYYDTPDYLLHRHGAEFRVRRNAKGFKQTVKYRLDGALLFSRAEAEITLPSAAPDLNHLRASIPPAVASELSDASFVPVFRTTVERIKTIFAHDGSTIELAYDQGQIKAGDKTLALHEVELELKDGSACGLAAAALAFAGKVPCGLLAQGKAPRGYDLAMETEPQPVSADKQEIPPDVLLPDAIAALLRAAFAHALANQASLLAAAEPESVHQMRVGLRRFTSIISAFRPALNLADAAPLLKQTKAFFAQLGEMREADVFLHETIRTFPAELLGEERRAILLREVTHFRERARKQVANYVSGPAFAMLALGWLHWLEASGWLRDEQPLDRLLLTRPVGAFASARLRKMNGKLMKRGHQAVHGGVDDWHEARIAAKKLRYAGGPLLAVTGAGSPAGDPVKNNQFAKDNQHVTKRLAKLQDELGKFNDLCTVGSFLGRVSAAVPARSRPGFDLAAAFCDGWSQAQLLQAIPRLEESWARFESATKEPS